MATSHAILAPIVLAGQIPTTAQNQRSRIELGSVPGPGLLIWLAVELDQGGFGTYAFNIYHSTAELPDLDSSTATAALEGIPLLPGPYILRGVSGFRASGGSSPAVLPVRALLPPGAIHLYACLGNTSASTLTANVSCGFQPLI